MLLILSSMSRVLLIFIDGLGIGTRCSHNPLARLGHEASPLAVFENEEPEMPFNGVFARTDACLGVEGRPQSASGQTTILTGTNAPAALGYHKQGFPNAQLREIINDNSIFLQLKRAGIEDATFANAYSPRFFHKRPRWVSATTTAVEAAGLPFRTLEDLRAGRAVYQDFTNQMVIEAGFDVETRTPEEAAEVLACVVSENRFTLYEYFLTDRAGHAQDESAALSILANLARFVRAVVARVDLEETTVVLTSDHGNIEDLSIRNHTRNLVPTLAFGEQRERVRREVRDLSHITPTILRMLSA
ncbi:MAG: 2,3-bisphosphoglycerate-independent phosphoglycerate mutase [Acidobacteriota bacterium]|nr:2,3-bisphosphoglycerate-independent phosphoglycerate mutase [Acidobacteriota bacterium]